MKKTLISATLVFVFGCAHADSGPHWGYTGEEAPENWGSLSPKFSDCDHGKDQSPIDLSDFVEADLTPLAINYQAGGKEVINNGHSIQVNYAPGSKISLEGHEFELKQFHFHTPSENHIKGESFPMEAHLVHADKDGNLAVIGVMFDESDANDTVAQIWAQMPDQAGEKNNLPANVKAEGLLPKNRDYYRFNGSLTTPPCTEGVWWFVMKEPVKASKAQIEKFTHVMHHPNNRPVQPVNARPVLQ